jgi:hypothetical protein
MAIIARNGMLEWRYECVLMKALLRRVSASVAGEYATEDGRSAGKFALSGGAIRG